ncbi:hypothetical protein DFO77_1414 [Marinilabilia salmonicolor]|jgi:putative effector of murein hydrolase LrgA (UPF0299 family)|uniref:DUF998 domain-containing protein n=2 Tax=Marinilabilia salmonicolor TaxID=989 RepID=A0A2T0WZ87_9BACT|nr:hypothetical protein BY457_12271 [Marinilabilia salmonicolor]RCW26085.1 hypothetical protein DFO77_1414 [Marinilabilia salmonicolor]
MFLFLLFSVPLSAQSEDMFKKLEQYIRNHVNTRLLRNLSVFAIIFIPLGTWLFATNESPLDYTMSMIGNKLGYRLNFIIWGAVTGFLLIFYVLRLFVLKAFKDKRARRLLIWSLLFLMLTVLIPAVDYLPVLSKLHTIAAIAFALSLMASLYLFVEHLHRVNKSSKSWSMAMFWITIGGSLLLHFLFGNTGVFELFFFFSLAAFLLLLRGISGR